ARIMEGVSTETQTPTVNVTEAAARRVLKVAGRDGRPDAYLRIRIVAGGCDGFEYELGLEDAPAEGDEVLEAFGLRVVVDPRSVPSLSASSSNDDMPETVFVPWLFAVSPPIVIFPPPDDPVVEPPEPVVVPPAVVPADGELLLHAAPTRTTTIARAASPLHRRM